MLGGRGMFYGRQRELDILNDCFKSDKFESILVTGRRRIGKTSLIIKALDSFKGLKIYYECNDSGLDSNLKSLSNIVNTVFSFPSQATFDSLESLLDFVFQRSLKEEVILSIDEYPYLRQSYPGLDSILQVLIDKYHEESKLRLIISGSYVKTMKEMLLYSNPLYGRFTKEIILSDLDYLEASHFYPNYSLDEKVKAYAVFGGNPYYLSLIDPNIDVKENIIKNVLQNRIILDSPLHIFSDEIKNIGGASSVFSAISSGKHKFSDLTSDIITSANLPNVLDPLLEMELITKEAPINMQNNRKKTFYYIKDNYLDFFYKYIYSRKSILLAMGADNFFNTYISDDLNNTFVPLKFEKLVKEAIILLNKKNKLVPLAIAVGKYWYDDPKSRTNGEFDVVYEDINHDYHFVEAKYLNSKVGQKIVDEEIEQVGKLRLKKFYLGFASKSGFDLKNKADYLLLDLNDLYSI